MADVGAREGPTVIFHGHLDVVPAREGQFEPRVEGDRLIGRGAYDMKGALASMMCAVREAAEQDRVRVRFLCVPDEESEDVDNRSTDALVAEGLRADFALTGEPTDLHIGVQAKGVLAVARRGRRGTAAHGSTPWLGDNAILKAHDAFRRIETLPFSRESSDMFDRAVDQHRAASRAATRSTRSRTRAAWTSTSASCPTRTRATSSPRSARSRTCEIVKTFTRAPAIVSRRNPYVLALRDAVGRSIEGEALSVGRDGASDVISFLQAGVPAVEFGPIGGGHHGPHEWVSISSLRALPPRARRLRPPAAGLARAPGPAAAGAGRRAGVGGAPWLRAA